MGLISEKLGESFPLEKTSGWNSIGESMIMVQMVLL